MQKYIALLRGINVSGQKKVPMAELRQFLEKIGFDDVVTYIQSGNVVFTFDNSKKEILEDMVQSVILESFGYEVPVLIKTREDIERILTVNPFAYNNIGEGRHLYYVLLKNELEEELKIKFESEIYTNEDFHITADCVYLNCKSGYGKAKLNNNLVERKLKVGATTRNHKTMQKLLELSK
ncbi:uncharacterized protein (DUF1697 family) [Flavobacteriaceae bacterium MAR_2009_75]|nr:uncharacterized protein (DUF1697 family) [Flavobacteriaceae bacterium MAR_2009_75]